jgi:hypothetical protein
MGSAALDIGTGTQARAATPKDTHTPIIISDELLQEDLAGAVSRAAGNPALPLLCHQPLRRGATSAWAPG